MSVEFQTLNVKPMASYVGAEINGVDVANCSEQQLNELKRALAQYGMVVLRDQHLSAQQQVDFAQRMGQINVNRFFKASAEHAQIAEVRKEPHQKSNIGSSWHTDHSYDQIPALGSILYAKDIPPVGGDTLFCSMHAVWSSLSQGLQQTLAGLRAHHSSRHVFGVISEKTSPDIEGRIVNAEQATQDAEHPVVIQHPDTGREILYVNPQFTVGIVGWHKPESEALLNYLYQHALKPEFSCSLRWEKNTLAIWDNRATWHCALNDYQGHARLMHRITLEGCELQPAATV